ncbi:hypothetical protein Tco_0978545 [Tanacetum coccineum]|uniref:Uncharacterized protein n=1 Tax=Tanacetum coccineum TaxID=301880 RepID=A0ABQ5ENP3_9ASTR
MRCSIESIADHTSTKKKIFGKKSIVEQHPISIDEYNDSESDSEYTRIIKKTKVKRTTVEEESVESKRKNIGKTMTDVKKKNKKFDDVEESESDMDSTQVKRKNMGKMIFIKIYSKTDEESCPVEKKEKIKMVLTEKYLKKKGKLVAEDSKITKKDLRKKGKMVVPIDEDEELTNEDDREYFKSKKFQNSLIQSLSKGNMLLNEIDHKLDKASVLNPKDDQLKKIIKKRNNLFFKSYIGGKKDDRYSIDAKVDFKSKDGGSEDDIWVDNGKSIVPFDDSYLLNSDSSLLETQSDENNTQSVDMQFDEITVQDDVDKKTGERKKIQCDKGYINEDLGFNFLSTGLEEIEYLIPGYEKGLSNNKIIKLNTFELLCMIDKQLENDIDVEPSNNGIELVNDLTQILSPKVDILDMQIGLPGDVQNDGENSIESKCFYGIKLNDVDSNRKEYGIQQLATKSQEKIQPPKNVTFYERKVTSQKVAEFIWCACNDGSKLLMQQNLMFILTYSDIVFKSKDMRVRLGIFESLFPNVEVASGILDVWSLVLNHEEKYREKNSGGGNIYCCSGMLTAKINIIDNLDNDVDDISVRYGELPIYLTKNTKDALEISIQ